MKGISRERKVSEEQRRGRVRNNKTHQDHLHQQHQPPTADRSGVGLCGHGLPENGAPWDRGEADRRPQHTAHPQRAPRNEAPKLWARKPRPQPAAPRVRERASRRGGQQQTPAPGVLARGRGCLGPSHTHHHSGMHSTPGTVSASSSIRQSLMK